MSYKSAGRVLVVGGRAITAMRRVSEHWVHNVAQGARCERAELTPEGKPTLHYTLTRASGASKINAGQEDGPSL